MRIIGSITINTVRVTHILSGYFDQITNEHTMTDQLIQLKRLPIRGAVSLSRLSQEYNAGAGAIVWK